ncbi:hypothetical protein CM15mP43_11870 [bacterium]|nr:MAG: hypothetical protein CM15mP43_11870 [bacterium]
MYDATFDSEELSKELEVILEEIKRGMIHPLIDYGIWCLSQYLMEMIIAYQ